MDSCRVCLAQDKEMTNLFDKNDDIIDKILFCTGIQFTQEDGLPHYICNICLNDLTVAHRFKTTVIANNSFQKLSNIKTEVNGDEGVNDDDCDDVRMDVTDVLDLKEEYSIDNNEDIEVTGNEGDIEWLESEKPIKLKKSELNKKNVKLKQKTKNGQRARVKEKDPYNKRVPCRNLEPFKKVPCRKLQTFKEVPLKELEAEAEVEVVRGKDKGEEQCWVCEICGQKFRHRGSLSTHIRSHLPPAYPCPQCSYRAAQKYDLTKHQRIHAGERPFQCDMCPATFYDASNMNSHIRRNHQKVLNFRCEVCGRGFYDRSKLNRHVDSHNNIKRHECSECHTAFTRLSYLKTHLRKRHGVELPPLRPGPQRRNLLVEETPVVYVKPKLIAVKQDSVPA